jgi:hypothetical protein
MGCCIPRKKAVSIKMIKDNKKNSQITLTKFGKSLDFQQYKYSPFQELTKYVSSPLLNINIYSSSNTVSFSPLNARINDNDKNQKKWKKLMKDLKNLSLLEVNNSQKYFVIKKKSLTN